MISTLEEIIDPNSRVDIIGEHSNYLILKEKSKESKISKLVIKNIPSNCFAFTLDCADKVKGKSYSQLSSYLNDSNDKGINKSCDLVIMYFKEDMKLVEVDLIDLKSDKIKPQRCESQLNNSELFIRYLLDIIRFHYSIDLTPKVRKTIIFTGRPKKVPVYRGGEKYTKPLVYLPLTEKNGKAEVYYKKIASC
ncbi:hypothetical protein ACPESL_03160 [Psychrobacter pocilloporae]|uniref:Uncharacterized protein n=1 Tax=Psychrobacter pacificensis TaxID=112002 RepID=A0A1G6WPD5_9GAMM|nr:hypothetical protein [Psychrobacter pacificensis]GLR29252.1 hypothetical protein GCM10007915_14900 [Psychrobacter pacificensis]SDD67087.1 hypothetical protein SAMN05660405_01000 [Psychrobacter pacificensis]